MKIATSLCLGLALFSPVFALRGTQKKRRDERRRLQEDGVAEAVEEVAEDLNREIYDETAPLGETAPVPETQTETGEAGTEEQESYTFFDPNKSPELNLGPTPPPTLPPNLQAPTWEQYLTEQPLPWTIDNYGLYSDEAKHKGGSGSSSKSKGGGGGGSDVDADPLCEEFCQDYMLTCDGANAFFNPDEPRGGGTARRRLIAGEQLDIPRLKGSVFESLDDCLEACVEYPRPTNPALYLDPEPIGINSIGDTFWCRQTHLKLAKGDAGPELDKDIKTTHFGAQVHCPFAAPSGGGLCTNVPIDSVSMNGYNASAYEFIRAGTETSRHLGYCQMYFNDIVADCTSAGIDDRTLKMALALIPIGTEVLILNNNVGKRNPLTGNTIGEGITILKDQLFRGLMCPECIKALIIDDGNVATIEPGAFTALRNLESLSLNMQMLTAIPSGMLENAPKLRELSIYNTRNKPGQITSVPADLFTNRAQSIRRIVISGHRGLVTLPAALFTGLDGSLVILIMSNNGFTNDGITTTMFQNLNALQIFDLSNNQFQTAEAGWINGGWAISLRNVYLQQNPMTKVEDGIFDYNNCVLENVLLHDTDLISVPINLFDFCSETLISYTVSPRV